MGNDRAKKSSNGRHDLRMAPQPASLYSTSHSSGRPLFPGPRVNSRDRPIPGRLSPPSSFSTDQQNSNSKPSSRKTKLIIVLGLTLPVLACIIGIVAWAMTTDIVRVSPQPSRTRFQGIVSKDKNKGKDSLQPRSDHDLDLLLPRTEIPVLLKGTNLRSIPGGTTSMSFPVVEPSVTPNASKATLPPTATEILSKLISTNVNKKGPPQFVVFAPVPDDSAMERTETTENIKTHIDDETDLVAEESSHSEEIIRDRPPTDHPFQKRRQSQLNTDIGHWDSRAGPQDTLPRRGLENRQHHPIREMGHPNFDSPVPPHHMMKNGNRQPPEMQLSNKNPSRTFHTNVNHPVNDDFPPRGIPGLHNDGQFTPQNQQQYPQPPPGLQNQQYPQQHNQYPQQVGDPNEEIYLRKYPQPPVHDSSYIGSLTSNNPGIPNSNKFGDPNKYESMYSGSHNQPIVGPFQEPNGQYPEPNGQLSSGYQPNGAPQYYAPPPQTFHTSTSYSSGNLQNPKPGEPLSTYENIGETVINPGQVSTSHHHHHHHHHHDPNDSGDTHLTAASSANDADRFGTLGIGLGAPRGITLQVGGLGGLLPIGALGLVRGLASSLLPRPQLGLNRKVFFGVEVGRGGGLSIG